jgi:microcin C transport system ATP-binding protein
MAMLFITHDLGIVRRIADRVCVMTDGKIVEQGPSPRSSPRRSTLHKHLLAAEPRASRRTRRTSAQRCAADDLKVWFPIKKGLLRKTVDHVKAVDGVDVTVREGQTLGIVGESGSGKTTLGLALLRLISSRGASLRGQDITAYSWKADAAAAQRHADCLPGSVRLASARACRWPRSSERAC